jgi:Dyp-type peroxidase family
MHTITVLTPLRADADPDAVAARLDALGDGPDSPFAGSELTHFARLVVLPADLPAHERPRAMRGYARAIDLLTHLGRRQRRDDLWRPYLVFSAGFDTPAGAGDDDAPDPAGDYVRHLAGRLGAGADAVWGACEGYPGSRDPGAFARFLLGHALPARYVFQPGHRVGVAGVRAALRLRRQVTDLATATAGGSPEQFRERFDATFPSTDYMIDERSAGGGPRRDHGNSSIMQSVDASGPVDEDAEWNGWVREDALAHPRLPRMAPATEVDLTDVQGLVVGYPAYGVAAYAVLRVTDAGRARRWLAGVEVTTAAEAHRIIDLAKPSRVDGDIDGDGVPDVAVHLAVSHAGLVALGVAPQRLAGFDRSFRAGMAVREGALTPGVGTAAWRAPFAPAGTGDGGVHVLLQLSAPDEDRLRQRLTELLTAAGASGGFGEPWVQHAARVSDPAQGDGPQQPGDPRRHVEHFGFTDGVSQPVIDGVTRGARATTPAELPAGELLLGHPDVDGDTAGATAPEGLARNGTYLVFRKLEQDVPAFRALVRDAAARRSVADLRETAAKLVGRRQDGTVLHGPEPLRPDFAGDPRGFGCPVGAHVRRVNPRDSHPLEDEQPRRGDDLEARLTRRHHMLRRGIPYGPWLPDGAGGDAGDDGDDERGLLFVALIGDIGRQFEFVQTQWLSDGTTLRLGSDRDLFSGAAGGGAFVIQGDPPVLVPTPRPVVTCRGGEYFLLPGVRALRALARA